MKSPVTLSSDPSSVEKRSVYQGNQITVYYGQNTWSFTRLARIGNTSKEELLDLLAHIQEIAGELGIHINMKKTRIVKFSSQFTFLQIKYRVAEDGKVYKWLTSEKVTAMRKKLKKLAAKVKSGEKSYDRVEEMFRSWMGSFYKLMTRYQRKGLIQLFEDLFDKRITVHERKLTFTDKEADSNDQ